MGARVIVDKGTRGNGDTEKRGHGEIESRGQGDLEKWGQGDKNDWKFIHLPMRTRTWRHGEMGTRGQ